MLFDKDFIPDYEAKRNDALLEASDAAHMIAYYKEMPRNAHNKARIAKLKAQEILARSVAKECNRVIAGIQAGKTAREIFLREQSRPTGLLVIQGGLSA